MDVVIAKISPVRAPFQGSCCDSGLMGCSIECWLRHSLCVGKLVFKEGLRLCSFSLRPTFMVERSREYCFDGWRSLKERIHEVTKELSSQSLLKVKSDECLIYFQDLRDGRWVSSLDLVDLNSLGSRKRKFESGGSFSKKEHHMFDVLSQTNVKYLQIETVAAIRHITRNNLFNERLISVFYTERETGVDAFMIHKA